MVGAAEVEVVEPERLLEDRRVLVVRQRQHGLAVVEHVVAADLVGAVREAVRVPLAARGQKQLGGVRRAAREDDEVAGTRSIGAVDVDQHLRHRRRLRRWSRAGPRSAFVSSVTFGCSSAGRTPSTSASDLPCTRTGTRRSSGSARTRCTPCSARSVERRTAHGTGGSPFAARSSESCWMRGSCETAGYGYGALDGPSVGSSPRAPCTSYSCSAGCSRARGRHSEIGHAGETPS